MKRDEIIDMMARNTFNSAWPKADWSEVDREVREIYIGYWHGTFNAIEAAGLRIVPVEALDRLLQSAAMLQQNSEEYVRRHHGFDTDLHGLPGWLRETAEDIREVRAMIEDSKEE